MDKLRLVIIIENFFPHIGGVEKFFLDLAKGLLKEGVDVRIVTSNSGGITGFHEFEGVDVYSYSWFTFSDHALPSLTDLEEHVCWADIVHTSTYTAAPIAFYAGKRWNKPVVITVHEFLDKKWAWIEHNPFLQIAYRLFERYTISQKYDYFVCDSDATKNDLLKAHIAPSHQKIQTVYLSVDTQQTIEEDRKELCALAGASEESTIFLYYGRPGKPKGIFVYLEAIKMIAPKLSVSEVKFLFILSPEPHKERERFLQKIEKDNLGSLVEVCASQPREQLLKYVKSSDFIVVPSITEGFGLTTTESCQLGKKVIHSSGGSLPEVASGFKILYRNRDSKDLAEKLEYALNGGKFKQTPLKKFTEEKMVQGYLTVYQNIKN